MREEQDEEEERKKGRGRRGEMLLGCFCCAMWRVLLQQTLQNQCKCISANTRGFFLCSAQFETTVPVITKAYCLAHFPSSPSFLFQGGAAVQVTKAAKVHQTRWLSRSSVCKGDDKGTPCQSPRSATSSTQWMAWALALIPSRAIFINKKKKTFSYILHRLPPAPNFAALCSFLLLFLHHLGPILLPVHRVCSGAVRWS